MAVNVVAPGPHGVDTHSSLARLRVGLDQLASLGGVDVIRDYLHVTGVTGQCANPYHCLVANYLTSHGYAYDVAVCPSQVPGRGFATLDRHCFSPFDERAVPLPQVVNDVAVMFDGSQFPELEALEAWF